MPVESATADTPSSAAWIGGFVGVVVGAVGGVAMAIV